MWLINTATWSLKCYDLADAPKYAILSHVWNKNAEEEVTFKDMKDLAEVASPRIAYSTGAQQPKAGFLKIKKTCELAEGFEDRGIKHVWIDTCCIDRSSSSELGKSINEMFKYYARAQVCFAHLADLDSPELKECQWFSRGWTLQELLASRRLFFYNQKWACIGTKASLVGALANITGIPRQVLETHWGHGHGHDQSTATIMSWASNRETREPEDMAYCLLGLFDVNMGLIPGEGLNNAFQRLQRKILKKHNDLTVLAWDQSMAHKDGVANSESPSIGCGIQLLAPSPSAFSGSARICPFPRDIPKLSITASGLSVSPDIPLSLVRGDTESICMCIGLRYDSEMTYVSVPLRKIGPRLFCRHPTSPLRFDRDDGATKVNTSLWWHQNSSSYRIVFDNTKATQPAFEAFRAHATYLPRQFYKLLHVVPEYLWDPEDQVFLRPETHFRHFFPDVLAVTFATEAPSGKTIVLYDNRSGIPRVNVVPPFATLAVESFLQQKGIRELSLSLQDLQSNLSKRIAIDWLFQVNVQEALQESFE